MKYDGADWGKAWVPESFAAGDHTLDFTLSDTATTWGDGAVPPSFREGEQPAIASLAGQSFQLDTGGTAKTALTIQNTTAAALTVELHASGEHVTVTGGPFAVPAGGRRQGRGRRAEAARRAAQQRRDRQRCACRRPGVRLDRAQLFA